MVKLVDNVNVIIEKVAKLNDRKISLEQELKEVGEELNGLLRKELPQTMAANGIQVGSKTQFKDYTIELKPFKNIKIVDEDEFFKWLEQNNYADIIKQQMSINTRYYKDVDKLRKSLTKMGLVYEESRSIHHQTLKSFGKEVDLQTGPGVEVEDGTIATIK